jgi:cardiolipin synthase A/B
LFPELEPGTIPATVLHNAPGSYRPITTAIAELLDGARETLDVVNPYVSDKAMIARLIAAARRGVRVRLFVPAAPNNRAVAAAQRHHHPELLEAGVQILGHPAMLHAKAFVRDGEEVLAGTCNLDAWSLKRFFEIDVRVRSRELAERFDERFSAPAEAVSTPGTASTGVRSRLEAAAFAAVSPLL